MSVFVEAHYRPLGATGMSISPIGLGTVKFGRNQGVKYPEDFELPDDKTLSHLLSVAHECGINLVDTAPAYGLSEERLGNLLAGQRDKWILGTKVGEQFIAGKSHWDFSGEATRRSVENSLRLLRTDYLDLVLVHCSDDDLAVIEHSDVLETLTQLKLRGDIRAIGVSSKSVEAGLKAVELTDVVMLAYHQDDTSQRPVMDAAQSGSKGVLVKKALESGHARDPGQALRFALKHAAVSSVIVGTINAAHLRANVAAITGAGGERQA